VGRWFFAPTAATRFRLFLNETMAQDIAFQKRIQRIGEVVEQLESVADPNSRAMAKELLESLMALHGAALERILELASEVGEAGQTIIAKCGRDELVSSVLLLYGLHPLDLHSRVTRALERLRPYLESHAANAELASVGATGGVRVRLHLKSNGCGSSTVKSTVEAALQDAAPDAATITVEETGPALMGSGFVSVAQLEAGQAMAALSVARAQRSGD
jgi:Fe-S cluster biogenesis protein NfuA